MAARCLKVSSLATALLASSGLFIYNRQLEFSDLSVVRFGRAAATVSLSAPIASRTWSGRSKSAFWNSMDCCMMGWAQSVPSWEKLTFVGGVKFSGCCRVCLQTAFISYDYLTAFKHVEYGTKEYVALRSKVDVPLLFILSAHGHRFQVNCKTTLWRKWEEERTILL